MPVEFKAIVRATPPVYDPGGPVALALSQLLVEQVEEFNKWTAESGAVIAIVPANESDTNLHVALTHNGYEAVSDWYTRSN